MKQQALHRMTDYEEVNTLQAQKKFTNLKHRRDYNAGDFVTVQNISWGLEAEIQITAVEVAENAAGRVETVTLGTGEKGYVRKLMTEIKNI
jgi:NADPH-dependent glutamate synthase beta subunit-like oxidoreductase